MSSASQEPSSPPHAGDTVPHTTVDTSDDSDGYGSGFSTETTSLVSSALHYKYENGRRYHAFGKEDAYPLPNDESEQDRLDLFHHIWSMILGGELYTAPLDNPQRILDVGTGTGIWAMDMADQHGEAEVIGNDLSPVQPTWVPPNLRFEIDDMERDWVYPVNHFDYIHMRNMANCFQDWDMIFEEAYEHLTPGGYIEIQDFDYESLNGPPEAMRPCPPDSAFVRWTQLTKQAAEKVGRPFTAAKTQGARLKKKGFINVTERWEIWPNTPWHPDKKLKEIGQYALYGNQSALMSYSVKLLTNVLGMQKEEVEKLCKDAWRDLTKGGQQYWMKAWFIYAQKPEEKLKKATRE